MKWLPIIAAPFVGYWLGTTVRPYWFALLLSVAAGLILGSLANALYRRTL